MNGKDSRKNPTTKRMKDGSHNLRGIVAVERDSEKYA